MMISCTMQDCQVGLNFAEQQEAQAFQNAVEEKINQRHRSQGQSVHACHVVVYF